MPPSLKVVSGPLAGDVIPIDKPKFLIGRDEECHFRPEGDLVSRHHCVLKTDEYGVRVRDLGSRGGTLVNGEAAHGEKLLAEGDTITVGGIMLQVRLSAPNDSAPNPASGAEIGAEPPVLEPPRRDEPAPAEPPLSAAELLRQQLERRAK
jgi:pSer/pThr/pTyr-binding forkhead associated (FHA) protein